MEEEKNNAQKALKPSKFGIVSFSPPNSNVVVQCRINADKKSLTRLDGNNKVYEGVMQFMQAVTAEFKQKEEQEKLATSLANANVFDPFADFAQPGSSNSKGASNNSHNSFNAGGEDEEEDMDMDDIVFG